MSWACDYCGGDRATCNCTVGDHALCQISETLLDILDVLKALLNEKTSSQELKEGE